MVQFLLVRHRNGVPRLFQWPSRNERKARDGRRRVDRNESKAMMGKESGTLHEQLRFAVWNSQGVEVVQELLNRVRPSQTSRISSSVRWRAAERRHPTQAARGWASPPCRNFKIQSCCCPGSALEWRLSKPLERLTLCNAQRLNGASNRPLAGLTQPRPRPMGRFGLTGGSGSLGERFTGGPLDSLRASEIPVAVRYRGRRLSPPPQRRAESRMSRRRRCRC